MCMVLLVIKWWITLPMGLNPLLGCEVLKDNPQIFEEA